MNPTQSLRLTAYLMRLALLTGLTALLLASCTKQTTIEPEAPRTYFRVMAVGTDTTFSPMMAAREMATEDAYLRVKYLGYQNGAYRIQVKNYQNCSVDISIVCTGFTATIPAPSVGANQTSIFEITGPAVACTISVKALTVCEYQGTDPVWLVLDLTESILPITFINPRIIWLDRQNVRISFSVGQPGDVDVYYIQKSLDGKAWSNAAVIYSDGVTSNFSVDVKL